MRIRYIILLLILAKLTVACSFDYEDKKDFSRWVNPFIGTLHEGHCIPGATVPMGMVQVGPESYNEHYEGYEMDHVAGYQYNDPWIWGFTQTHLNGAGCPSLSDILLMPLDREKVTSTRREDLKSTYDKATEKASPGYYMVHLLDPNVKTELTATEHVAYHRYTYANPQRASMVVDLQYGVSWDINNISENILEASQQFEDDYTLTGYRCAREWVARKLFYVIRFNKRIKDKESLPTPDNKQEKAPRYLISFDMGDDEILEVMIGLSATSIEAAKANLAAETSGWSTFDRVRTDAKQKWNSILSKIDAQGDDDQLTSFYTSLYRLYIQPNNIADVAGTYRTSNDSIAQSATGRYYSTFSLWDSYRAANPLYTILTPDTVADFVTSMMDNYRYKPEDKNNPMEANKYLPRWALWGRETNTMIGNHAIAVISDAWQKGIKAKGYSDAEVYDAMWNTATKPHYRNHVQLIDQYGYIPYDQQRSAIDDGRETVARLLEGIYDDYCLSRVAQKIGKTDDAKFLINRSGYYRNVFDKESGFMRGRRSDGTFKTGVDPDEIVGEWLVGSDFTEGNSWHYLFHVQHDVVGMKEMMGDELFLSRLDSMFLTNSKPEVKTLAWNIFGTVGQYWHGNEPCHHVPYLYKYTSESHKTDALIRFLVSDFSRNAPDGLKGNDDCGQMSAWYIFASLGFYPVNPCGGSYIIGAPQLPEATINLPNGKRFKVVAENISDENYVVSKVQLNDKILDRNYVTYDEIVAGGELRFKMEAAPDSILQILKYKANGK